ncbi:MAG TPA: nuclear transport factor 2 family protein, partial [Methylomirabilota bacterium]
MNVVERFAEAFNQRDVDGLLALFTADASYRDLFYGPHAGETALRGMFERMFHEGRDYRWSMEAIVTDERRAAAEWTFGYTA